ncbi:hypothetical protein [Acrocarpospora sp. B8E8]|uniref:hypothetical protein n=1 Tax=Acrocarpospora sp. B8E8 TaxID=3153572 RepID=UPI00325C385F
MTRLTLAALYKVARTASGTPTATLTIATRAETDDRYAAWSSGCLQLPHDLVEELAFPPDGSYTITSKGALSPTEIRGFRAPVVVTSMLPLLDADDRAPVEQTGWLNEEGILLRRYLRPDGRPPIAVSDDHWQAWAKHLEQPAWHTPSRGGLILWAPDERARATALLGTIHPRFTPDLPEWTADL